MSSLACPAPAPVSDRLSPADFRGAMSLLASTVCVITAQSAGCRFGMTATSVTAVSDNPATLLACVNKQSRIADVIASTNRFGINVLGAEHRAIAEAFSRRGRGPDTFEPTLWTETDDDCVTLRNALATFVCRVSTRLTHATHSLFIGEVERCLWRGESYPLLYHRRRYTIPAI
jgi:flavin reductase